MNLLDFSSSISVQIHMLAIKSNQYNFFFSEQAVHLRIYLFFNAINVKRVLAKYSWGFPNGILIGKYNSIANLHLKLTL